MTTTDHERIEELLAGYVLWSLAGDDATEADRLLGDHVPGCEECRETLAAFQEVSAELAWDATPIDPPETLLPRLHRQLDDRTRRRRPMATLAVAASVAAVVGLGGLALSQNMRASDLQSRAADISAALEVASRPDANLVPVGPAREISAPGEETFYVYGSGVPAPPSGAVYRVWLVASDGTSYAGELEWVDGEVFLEVALDPSVVHDLLITTEPAGSTPSQPGQVVWASSEAA